jgi:hypothetical protein
MAIRERLAAPPCNFFSTCRCMTLLDLRGRLSTVFSRVMLCKIDFIPVRHKNHKI